MANTGGKRSNGSQFFITLERADILNGKYTLFGKVDGSTVYNLMKIGQAEVNAANDRPVNPPRITNVEVLVNPFPDIQPRLLALSEPSDEEEYTQAVPCATLTTKKTCLLSFGADADSDEDGAAPVSIKTKAKSAHDLLDDPKLSKAAVEIRTAVAEPAAPEDLYREPAETDAVAREAAESDQEGAEDGSEERHREIESLQKQLRARKRDRDAPLQGHDGASYLTRKQLKMKETEQNVMDRLAAFTKRLSKISKDASLVAKDPQDTDEDLADGSWFAGRKLQFSVDSVKAYEVDAARDTVGRRVTQINHAAAHGIRPAPGQGQPAGNPRAPAERRESCASGTQSRAADERPRRGRRTRAAAVVTTDHRHSIMQIQIKTLTGRRLSFDFEPSATIAHVKRVVQRNEPSLDLRQMRLIFSGRSERRRAHAAAGRHLSDELTLKDYKVSAGSTIHMVLQLRGG
ncbi:peptidyl-prolyl cis-trans isomerase [Babesia caballi]|uniref:Peptidyl-prolyl cis-trans isomerase n=1 Tax=Babesia caballi TaxID=5871 RepID=A0AAV4LX47_BABCB|nr:peptidyl-prolyl cis-trans isomerase [Babesia caballi]